MVTTAAPLRAKSDNRRSNKPIMEKRRRARINNCLNELKSLVLDAMKKDPGRHSKLEKADILEMTVKHVEAMQRQQVALAAATDPKVLNKFRAGFSECAGEVGRFPGLEPPVKARLLEHLASCLEGRAAAGAEGRAASGGGSTTQGVQVSLETSGVLQLVPTRLPNGDIALVLPSPPPLLPPSSPLSLVVRKQEQPQARPPPEPWRPW